MKRHSESCSCTNCAYKSRSKRPSVQQIVADGTRIDKLFYGKYLPLRERKLLEKLVRTRAVYDNVKDRLLSASGSSDLTRSDYTGKSRAYYRNRKKKMIEVTDRGEIRSSNTSKLSSCCNCCSCSSLKKIKESIEKHPHVHKHYVPYENIAKYSKNDEMRAKARRRRLGSKISEKMRDLRYKSKNIRSDPCFCTLSLIKFSSKRSIKKLKSKEDAKRSIGPTISFAGSELERRSKAGQKLRSIQQSIVNSIETRFKIKKDSLSLFRAKLRKRAMRRRRHDSESYTPEFRPRRRRRKKKSHHRLSGIYVKSVTSATSKLKFKTSAVKMKSKRKMRKRHKSKGKMMINRESQVSVLGKITSKPSQYQQRKYRTSSSITNTSLKTSSKSGVQTQIKPRKKYTTKYTINSSTQSNSSYSLKKNQTEFSLRRCFCTLKLKKKKRKLRSSISKKTTSSFSTQHSDKRDHNMRNRQTKSIVGEHDNVPKETLVSPTECECDTEMRAHHRKEIKRNRKLTNTEKIPQKSTTSLIFERSPHTRQEKTQSEKRKMKHAYAKAVEVHRPSVNDMPSQVVKSNKTKPTNTEAFWHKCFCTLKFFNKDSSKKHSGTIIQPQKKKDVIVRVHSRMTNNHSENMKYFHEPSRFSSFECEPGICSPDQCNPQECKKFIKARHARSKNKYSDTSSKNIVLIHENPKLLPYECEPGVCIPGQCNPSECQKLIKHRNVQHKNNYKETNVDTRSTYSEIPRQIISSKTQQSLSLAREKKTNKINHYPKEPEEKIGSGHSNRETVRIGSNISFNIEFYKERPLVDSIKESDNTSKAMKKETREKPFRKPKYTRSRQTVNIKTRGLQSTTNTKHIASSAEPKTKKRHVYVGSPKKTKCFCTLKLHKKGRNAKNKENIFLTSRSTKTTLEMFEPGLNTSVIKSTNTSKIFRHKLKSNECAPGFCVPNKCDPYKCYDSIRNRGMRRYHSRHIATGRELRSVLSMTSTEFSSSNKSRSTQSSNVVQPLQEHRVKNRPEKIESNYSPSRQAVRIGSNFSFNLGFYKENYNTNTREKTIPTMYNTVGNLTYICDIKPKSMKHRQYVSKHRLLRASDIVKTNDKVPNVGNILKRCFCSLMLHTKDCGRNDYNPCSFNPEITQLTEIITGQKYKKSVCKFKSLNPICIPTGKFSEKYISGRDLHMTNIKLNRNGGIVKIKSQNGYKANNCSKSSHSSYNDFRKYVENSNNSIPKLQQYSEYQVEKVLNDPTQRNTNPFYNSFYALNLKVSRARKIPQGLEDDECEPDFCVPYQCDAAECLRRIKSRLKSWKETGTDSLDTRPAASMTDRMRLSHNYVQADKHSALKVFHPRKGKKRYGSNVKLNMSFYTHLDDTNKEPGKRTTIPQFYDAYRNKTENEKKKDYDRPAPTRQKPYYGQNDHPQREDIISSKHKSRRMSLKKYAASKFKFQDKQRDMIEAAGDGTNQQQKLTFVPKSPRKQLKTTNIQTEAKMTKSIYVGKEHKSMNIATDDAALQPEVITELIHSSKFPKRKNIAMENEIMESQPIQYGKSRKSVHIADPEVVPKVIYSGKYHRAVHVPMNPYEIPKSVYRGKYREKINSPTEPEASKSSFSSKYRKHMKIRTDRASRLSRSRRTKMPEELEKFLMKPPRRKVYTIGSNINFSMQFYKEDDSLAVEKEQETGQTDAGSGMIEKIRCFCTSKKRGTQDIKSKKEGQGGDKELGKESKKEIKELVSKGTKEEVSKKSREIKSKILGIKSNQTKSNQSKMLGMEKSAYEGSQKIEKSDLVDESQRELDQIFKSELAIAKKPDKARTELTKINEKLEHKAPEKIENIEEKVPAKIEKSKQKVKGEHEITENIDEGEHDVSDKIRVKSICKCKMPVCTCKMPVCKCESKKKEGRKEKEKKIERKKGHKNKNALCDCDPKSRRLRSKSTKVSHDALSVKSDVLSYDKSTLTGGKRFTRSLYECEPHVCIPGICDPNVCFKIFKSKRPVKNIAVSATQDVKSKLVSTPITFPSMPLAASAIKRCFCILQLKNKPAQHMIEKSMTPKKQKKDIQRPEVQNFLRKSFGKVSTLLTKPKISRPKAALKLEAENVQLLKQGMDMKPAVPEYAFDGSKLPEVSSKKRKRHICKCHKNTKGKAVCECVQKFLDSSKYLQPELPDSYQQERIETPPHKVAKSMKSKAALGRQDKPKLKKIDQKLSLKSKYVKRDGSETITKEAAIPQTKVKVGQQPICKCKKQVLHKSVCKCQLQAMDDSTALEPETPLTDTSEEKKIFLQKIKSIPPRLSQSLKLKLAGSIKKRDKTKPRQPSELKVEKTISELRKSKSVRRKDEKVKNNVICECKTCKCALEGFLDTESSKTDLDTKKKKLSYKNIPLRISKSLKHKSLILSTKKTVRLSKIKQEIPKKPSPQRAMSTDVNTLKSEASSISIDKQKKSKSKSQKQSKRKKGISICTCKDIPICICKGISICTCKPIKEHKSLKSKSILLEPRKLDKIKQKSSKGLKTKSYDSNTATITKKTKSKTGTIQEEPELYKSTEKLGKVICECQLHNFDDLEEETTDAENLRRGQSIIEATRRISRSLKSLKSPSLGLSLKKQPNKPKKQEIDSASETERPSIYKKKKGEFKQDNICECPLQDFNDLEEGTTDTEKVSRGQSIIEAARRISRSLKSLKSPSLGLSLNKQPQNLYKKKKGKISIEAASQSAETESMKKKHTSKESKHKPHFICECYPKKSEPTDKGVISEPPSPISPLGDLAAGDTKSKSMKPALGDQIVQGLPIETKAAGDQELKEVAKGTKRKRKSKKIEQPATLAVCPCCGKSNHTQSLKAEPQSVCECNKSDTSFFKCLRKKKKSPPGPMIPGLENACPVCLRQNLTDICTCDISNERKDVYLPATHLQNVCPECSKKKLAEALQEARSKPPQASSRKSYSGEPNVRTKIESQKKTKNKDEPPPPPPIFNMYVDATNMKVKNKEEIYRNLGIGCKDKLEGCYLPPLQKGQVAKPSIDLVIDRDNASILRPDDMMQSFGDGDRRKYSIPKKGETKQKAGTSHSVACPICNPLQVGGDATKSQEDGKQDKEHDKHCTCCICTDKDGKRKKGHPKNCTCCICRYGCRFGSTRRATDSPDAESLKFLDKSQLLKYDEKQKKKVEPPKKKPEVKKKVMPVTLQAQNKLRNFTKALQAPRSCYCGLRICDREIKKLETKASSGLQEKKKSKDEKHRKETFQRWKKEARARIKEQDAEDAELRKRVLRQDKKAMAVLEKYIDDSNSWVLLAENASEIGRFGINTMRRMITSFKRCVRHPLDVCYRAQIAREDPRRAAAKALEEFQGSGYSGMAARVRQRCAAMQTSRYLISALERHPVTNYLLHFRDRDPKKRLFKRKPEKEPPEVECSPFLTSLRQKPCLWLYRLCPWFYPHCLGLLAFWRQFTDVVLFLLAVVVWSPCILLTEFCRTVMCCFMCAGGG
ncbi:unnamed protein product [Arctia plantaginis]|uniref:Uncharacterized protein n=1 Tax=Arctia plantaginis TaxID=874455 RepID=A0A8S1A9R8_ARCPL|nr:unnamed protein product [Arctia plantaginis]